MSRFEKLKGTGALDAIDGYVADIDINKRNKVEEKKESEERFVRSYSLTKSQLKMLHEQKLEEIGVSLSDIVGKAIEMYCSQNNK